MIQKMKIKNNKSKYIIKEELQGIRLDKCVVTLDGDISRMAARKAYR